MNIVSHNFNVRQAKSAKILLKPIPGENCRIFQQKDTKIAEFSPGFLKFHPSRRKE
jgi:hypothetical protein